MKIEKNAWGVLLILLFYWNTIDVFANGTHAPSEKESTEQIASARPDNYAPLGVTGDHVHSAGEMMFSYRSIGMAMDGLRDGTAISIEEALYDYLMVPLRMRMRMHMFGAMFAPHDRITLIAMMSHRNNSMKMKGAHLHSPGGDGAVGHHHIIGDPSMTTAGPGDLKLSALIPLLNTSNADLLLNAGVSIPTGYIDLNGSLLNFRCLSISISTDRRWHSTGQSFPIGAVSCYFTISTGQSSPVGNTLLISISTDRR